MPREVSVILYLYFGCVEGRVRIHANRSYTARSEENVHGRGTWGEVVLVTAATAGGMGRVAMVDVESGVMDSQPVTNLNISGLTPRCLAYRLYTSGKSVYINDFKRIFVDYLHQAPLVSPKLSLLKSRALCKLSAPQSPSSHGNRIQGSSNSLQLPLICATTTVSWRGVMGLHFVLQRRNISLVTSKELS